MANCLSCLTSIRINLLFLQPTDPETYALVHPITPTLSSGCSAARLARVVRDDEVVSSNLTIPTKRDIFFLREMSFCFNYSLLDVLTSKSREITAFPIPAKCYWIRFETAYKGTTVILPYCEKFSRDIRIPLEDFFSLIKILRLCIFPVLPDLTSMGTI